MVDPLGHDFPYVVDWVNQGVNHGFPEINFHDVP